jgi:hypothetical protein
MEKLIIATALLAAGIAHADSATVQTSPFQVRQVTVTTDGNTKIIKTNTWATEANNNTPIGHRTNLDQSYVDLKNKNINVGTISGGNQVIVETKMNIDPNQTDTTRDTYGLTDKTGKVVGVRIIKTEVQNGQVLKTSIYRVFANPNVKPEYRSN